ncbi:hypothetical protein [Glaciimonas immobilis]|uniref:Uncharacterized protein n=1 Tax=Glaciimonas immobilis TaxID=728004 RepID=A0A840RUW0_9BURK|nr:hypothetical protein [Glaciimonas immobilis]KAF3999825.1 hypothetical protein HAV38_01135 [Glaciimonas immobilis]MBB5200300.1 hypothetical protein [Glaciimonas immobilis]
MMYTNLGPKKKESGIGTTKQTPLVALTPKINPHFRNISRAPYEIGFLLKGINDSVSSYAPITDDEALQAEAIAKHAENELDVISRGLEAIGEMVSIAACSLNTTLEGGTVSAIGEIIRHLTVECQLMRDIGDLMTDAVAEHKKRRAQ